MGAAPLRRKDLTERSVRAEFGPSKPLSGARITGALARLLAEKDAQFGVATMCIGMGQGVATVLERVN